MSCKSASKPDLLLDLLSILKCIILLLKSMERIMGRVTSLVLKLPAANSRSALVQNEKCVNLQIQCSHTFLTKCDGTLGSIVFAEGCIDGC